MIKYHEFFWVTGHKFTLRLDAIICVSTTKSGKAQITWIGGQSATVTQPYNEIRDMLRNIGVDIPVERLAPQASVLSPDQRDPPGQEASPVPPSKPKESSTVAGNVVSMKTAEPPASFDDNRPPWE